MPSLLLLASLELVPSSSLKVNGRAGNRVLISLKTAREACRMPETCLRAQLHRSIGLYTIVNAQLIVLASALPSFSSCKPCLEPFCRLLSASHQSAAAAF